MAAVAVGVDAGDGLLVELGEKDVGDGVVDGVGRVLEEVGEADVQAAFAQADGGVERGEAAEANVERGDGRAGTEFAVLVLEDGDEGGRCGGFLSRVACVWVSPGGIGALLRESLEESGRWRRRRRRKELQKLTQRGGAGMLRCGQSLVSLLRDRCLY